MTEGWHSNERIYIHTVSTVSRQSQRVMSNVHTLLLRSVLYSPGSPAKGMVPPTVTMGLSMSMSEDDLNLDSLSQVCPRAPLQVILEAVKVTA